MIPLSEASCSVRLLVIQGLKNMCFGEIPRSRYVCWIDAGGVPTIEGLNAALLTNLPSSAKISQSSSERWITYDQITLPRSPKILGKPPKSHDFRGIPLVVDHPETPRNWDATARTKLAQGGQDVPCLLEHLELWPASQTTTFQIYGGFLSHGDNPSFHPSVGKGFSIMKHPAIGVSSVSPFMETPI